MKKFLIATSLLTLSFGISNAQEPEINIQEQSKQRAEKIFDAIDENLDGNINKDEFVQFHSKLVEKRMEKYMPEEKVEPVEDVEIQTTEETTVTEEIIPEVEENGDIMDAPEDEIMSEEEAINEDETSIQKPSF